MTIIFLLEERSMKEVLDIILPKILPADVCFKTIPHSGKSDLQESIPRKLKAWRQPASEIFVLPPKLSHPVRRQEIPRSNRPDTMLPVLCMRF